MITAEVAVYPLKTNHATNVIDDSINVLKNQNVDYCVGSMNTTITGSQDQIFSSLKQMFNEAERSGGEVSMVVTISNACE
ncbi:YkoF family thiamine/hydroxymethylpyrimidine-binding protein [Oceanirhabdus sp. W0125-5]|uniref:YkoF family thiamine/hydroxymethylpyrimidine-binding protein n=1 Tax=Oceanirhabdus sp. W0125-5 TaxID=2999116 RepID=UPI0022F30B8E|nr:YkoF family thiamine/hydroxymethylpyrimidine-binding protein [Oceanirhabdus sp. W0125-5]WBW95515.1 YkoF family thiamine/hydroxymethylpyrimidine-binding protein [Oceanirhabdus sp. W0125-5]